MPTDKSTSPQQSDFVRAAIERMYNAPPFFTPEQRAALSAYDGPVVGGDPLKFLASQKNAALQSTV